MAKFFSIGSKKTWLPMAMVTYRSYPKLPMDIGHFAVHLKVLAEASSKRWTTYGYLWLCLPIGHIQNYIWIFDSWRSLKSLGRSKQQEVDYLWLPMAMFTYRSYPKLHMDI